MSLLFLLLAPLVVPSSGYSFDLFDFNTVSQATKDKVNAICEKRGGLNKPPGKLLVDGYYLERTGPMFGSDDVVMILTHDRFQFFEMEDIEWRHSSIREIKTGKVYAGYKSFDYCWKGRKESGSCRGGLEQRYICPRFPKGTPPEEKGAVITYFTLYSTPNLKKRIKEVEIHEPIKVPINHVVPKLLETITDSSKIEVIQGDEYYDLYMPADKEGRVWFESRDVRWK